MSASILADVARTLWMQSVDSHCNAASILAHCASSRWMESGLDSCSKAACILSHDSSSLPTGSSASNRCTAASTLARGCRAASVVKNVASALLKQSSILAEAASTLLVLSVTSCPTAASIVADVSSIANCCKAASTLSMRSFVDSCGNTSCIFTEAASTRAMVSPSDVLPDPCECTTNSKQTPISRASAATAALRDVTKSVRPGEDFERFASASIPTPGASVCSCRLSVGSFGNAASSLPYAASSCSMRLSIDSPAASCVPTCASSPLDGGQDCNGS
mmetsp:Transcript_43481/g.100601  ORF Transcript_43481/g.100601 Transcript_43481/m.100601 type:complete len:277 (+) Transcript_43481:756-1586(+)